MKKDLFKQGYFLAVANILRTHADSVVAEDVLKQYGSLSLRDIPIEDRQVLDPIIKEIKRKQNLTINTK